MKKNESVEMLNKVCKAAGKKFGMKFAKATLRKKGWFKGGMYMVCFETKEAFPSNHEIEGFTAYLASYFSDSFQFDEMRTEHNGGWMTFKLKKAAAKRPAKQKKPWAERRNEVLAKARAVLQERVAAGRAALEPEPGVPEEIVDMSWKEAAKQGPFGRSDGPVTTVVDGQKLKWKSRKAAMRMCAEAILCCDGSECIRYANALASIVIGDRVAHGDMDFGE